MEQGLTATSIQPLAGMNLTHLLASLGLVAGEILGSLLGGLPSGNNAAPGTILFPETPNRDS
jgi:hypothetical protein